MIDQKERPQIVRGSSYTVAIGVPADEPSGHGRALAPDGDRTVTTPTGRQVVPTGPFAVLSGSAVVEFDASDSLLYLRSGMVCDFAPQAGATWVVASPLTIQRVGRCPWHEQASPIPQRTSDRSEGGGA